MSAMEPHAEKVPVSPDSIEAYIAQVTGNGDRETTARIYRATLRRLYKFLGSDKQIDGNTLTRWTDHMMESGLSGKTIASYRRAAYGFYRYLGCPDDWFRYKRPEPVPVILNDGPDMNRAEYLLLLCTARELGHERAYLIIKTLCQTGITGTELSQLSVEMLRNGWGNIKRRRKSRIVTFPPLLRGELLRYAEREKISTGRVFVTRDGAQLHHVLVHKLVAQICRHSGLPMDKGRPGSLVRLYWSTRTQLHRNSPDDAEQEYITMLEAEEENVRWPR